MLGWINDCIENLIVEQCGNHAWQRVKNIAGCGDVKDGGFLRLEHYPDQSTLDLVKAANELSGMTQSQILESVGVYFVTYIIREGYENLLFFSTKGSCLKDWMTNINTIHQHLQTTFPTTMTMPEFWCEESSNSKDGSLTLYYYSSRGNFLAPMAAGIVTEVARQNFQLDIVMKLIAQQGVDGSRYTSWHVTTKDKKDLAKLCCSKKNKTGGRNRHDIKTSSSAEIFRCPMSGMEIDTSQHHLEEIPGIVVTKSPKGSLHNRKQVLSARKQAGDCSGGSAGGGSSCRNSTTSSTRSSSSSASENSNHQPEQFDTTTKHLQQKQPSSCRMHKKIKESSQRRTCLESTQNFPKENRGPPSSPMLVSSAMKYSNNNNRNNNNNNNNDSAASTSQDDSAIWSEDIQPIKGFGDDVGGLCPKTTKRLFPYHVIIDSEFFIIHVGSQLPQILGTTEDVLYEYEIDEVFDFVKPRPAKWTKSWLQKLEDQEFVIECTLTTAPIDMTFKGTLISTSPCEVLLILCPDAKNLDELKKMKLSFSDLPLHGSYRDTVFLREHLSRQMNNALKMEKLSKTLQTEKELLESLLPAHAAEGLRNGKGVEPMLHNNVTMFFSDIVGFTQICKTISPWFVINMLNQLYGIMDHLAKKFNLFKVETIGDAYVCCSGLPESDSNHAVNVANFAVTVSKQSCKVFSPLDGTPLQLRIGVHTGACASGIVGVTNPRYCVFGDTVNTTSRHESTGEPGRVHCSLTTMIELMQRAPEDFNLISRGLVDMKGKGSQPTYWLESNDSNTLTSKKGLKRIDEEIKHKFHDILCNTMKNDDMDMSERHVVASPGNEIRKGLISKWTLKNAPPLSLDDEYDDDDDIDDSTLSTTSNSGDDDDDDEDDESYYSEEGSGDIMSGDNSNEDDSSSNQESSESSPSLPPQIIPQEVSKKQRKPKMRLRPRFGRPGVALGRHDTDLLKAVEDVEALVSSGT